MSHPEPSQRFVDAQRAAADWYALLCAEDSSDQERAQWRAWLAAAPEHAQAWALLETILQRFDGLPVELTRHTLAQPRNSRRTALKSLGVLLVAGAAAWGSRTREWHAQWADFKTSTGERRLWELADGTRLQLNARSAVDQLYDDQQRLLRLYQGEILVDTGHAAGYVSRPFIVETSAGQILALGTRFMVSEQNDTLDVMLFEGRLEIRPWHGPAHYLQPGQGLRLGPSGIAHAYPASADATAWERGLLIADDMPLGPFIERLARQRPGILGYDDAAAALRVSGVFPLDESDRVLAQLEKTLPIRLRRLTGYWVRVEALHSPATKKDRAEP
ncbi:FecR domain-containing protein [Azomonas macrocytogenes]|uniref:Transmembrane sensor n=1 Tax=Azomonas macrocytogenes TaxID=69962 RepID=A0A839T114_AZOMA|nr:FecR domain-containing protein [Azomonas macrocytogenes]MBB3102196.1 transmembrane sensor [Azomonas macrocytogenes]